MGHSAWMCVNPSTHCRSQIAENFIPGEEVEKVTRRAFYDEDMDEWKLRPLKPPAR